jgi:peptidoglycan/LPS O-acetylase OafA/YrhL
LSGVTHDEELERPMTTRIRAGAVAALAAALLAGAVCATFASPDTTPSLVFRVIPVAMVVVPGLLVAATRLSALQQRTKRYVTAVQVVVGLLCLAAVALLELGGNTDIGGGMALVAALWVLIVTTAVTCLIVASVAGDGPARP